MFYPTHSLGLIVGVTKERIIRVSCQGPRVGDSLPSPEENRYRNPFNNERALGYTDKGNICRFGVFWQVTAEGERGQWPGERMSCSMAGSGGQPQGTKKMGRKWGPWDVPRYWKDDRLPTKIRRHSGHGGSATFLSAEFIDALVEGREPTVNLYDAIATTAPGRVAHQ